MTRPSTAVRPYRTTPTPTRTSSIVKIFSAAPKGITSRKPTVVTVVTVWYTASSGLKPSTR